MADNNPDTIYADIDDEITVLIDKVKSSKSNVVALVLPKRASVLQSIVNMRLLKKTADMQKKNLVLITSEAGLMPLAGAVGLHVASSLNSKPKIPSPPMINSNSIEAASNSLDEDLDMSIDDDKELPDLTKQASEAASVGLLADAAATSTDQPLPKFDDSLETLELDNEPDYVEPNEEDNEQLEQPKAQKDKSLKVPNFDRFRTILIVSVVLIIILLVVGILAFFVWPHATIDIKTDAKNVNDSINLDLDSLTQTVNLSNDHLPASIVTQQKTYTQTVNTTGQKNEGATATGSVMMYTYECSSSNSFNLQSLSTPPPVPQGTGVTANNQTYITQSATNFSNSFSYDNKSGCFVFPATSSTNITAQGPGSVYNTGDNTTFSVSGFSNVTATGSASGGSDNIVQVVAQSDISSAESKIKINNSAVIEAALINQLKGQGLYPIGATFINSKPQITASPAVGAQANTVTVTETVTYSMYGVRQSALVAALNAETYSQAGKNHHIISSGLNGANFTLLSSGSSADQVSISATAIVGPNISVSSIKNQIKGKSLKGVVAAIRQDPDVTGVSVKFSPFYVTSVPSNQSNITVTIEKPTTTVNK